MEAKIKSKSRLILFVCFVTSFSEIKKLWTRVVRNKLRVEKTISLKLEELRFSLIFFLVLGVSVGSAVALQPM